MNLYKVYNGFVGFSAVYVLVIVAIKLAREKYKKESARYSAELIFKDCSKRQASEVSE